MSHADFLLAWIPLINPLKLAQGWRLAMFFPLALCVALVYRATRARDAANTRFVLFTVMTYVQIVAGMAAIAIAFYAIDEFRRRWMYS